MPIPTVGGSGTTKGLSEYYEESMASVHGRLPMDMVGLPLDFKVRYTLPLFRQSELVGWESPSPARI